MGARRSPATNVSNQATDAFDKLIASWSGSVTTVFAFQATPVMSFEVFTPME